MPKKSSKAAKATDAASKAVARPSRGTSVDYASAFSPKFFGANSSLGCTSNSAAIAASPTVLPSSRSDDAISSTSSLMVDCPPSLRGPPEGSVPAIENERICSAEQLILNLRDPDRRENTLAELSTFQQRIGGFRDLAQLLWLSYGTLAIRLQELLSVYPFSSLPCLAPRQINRVCNALTLLQCVASHPETRLLFAKACIPYYLFVLLDQIVEFTPFENIRLFALGVVAALLQVLDTKVVVFLLHLEIMPSCLRAMQTGNECSKTVSETNIIWNFTVTATGDILLLLLLSVHFNRNQEDLNSHTW